MNTKMANDKLEQFIELLQYTPIDFMDKIIASRIQEYEKLNSLDF